MGASLIYMRLTGEQVLVVNCDDIGDYYFAFWVSPEHADWNDLQQEWCGDEFKGWNCYDVSFAGQAVVVCLYGLGQGNGNAVEFGQAGHCGIAAYSGAIEQAEWIKYRSPPPRGDYWAGCTLDDHLGIEKEKGVRARSGALQIAKHPTGPGRVQEAQPSRLRTNHQRRERWCYAKVLMNFSIERASH